MKKTLSIIFILCLILSLSACTELGENFNNSTPNSMNVNATPDITVSSENSSTVTSSKIPSSSEVPSSSVVDESSSKPPVKKKKTFKIKLSFAGDVMIASSDTMTYKGSFTQYADENTPDYFLSGVQSIFANDDFTTVNLENVLSDDEELEKRDKGEGRAFWFRAPTDYTKILTMGSVEGVSIANNHTYDYGYKGYKDTTAAVKAAGLNYGNFEEIMYYEKNGFKIAVICYGLWRPNGVPTIKNLLKKAEKNSDYQILYFHGGEEGIYAPEEWKIEACHELVDAGADLIIGNHPHVLQPREIYKDTEIIYSLGNFCFGGNKKPKKNTIIYQMELTVNKKSLKVTNEKSSIIPCYVYEGNWNNYKPCLIKDKKEKKQVLDFMNGIEKSPYLS